VVGWFARDARLLLRVGEAMLEEQAPSGRSGAC
jgi:hypothetical protein